MEAWHDQDTWWEATSKVMFRKRAWEVAPQQVEQLALAGFEPPVRILDMPCGVGRHTMEFARLGCTVTAVDRTAAYLKLAREQANDLGLNVEFVQADMRQFVRPEAFDMAVNLFSSIGYFKDPADDVRVMRNFYESLRPEGALVIDVAGKEVIARTFDPRDWFELDDGTLVMEERKTTQDWSWIESRWIIMSPDGHRAEYPLALRLYGASDLRRALNEAGFERVRMYGSLSGTPYDHDAQRLVAVARKSG